MADNTTGIIYALAVAIFSALISVLIVRPLKQIGIVAAMLLTNGMNVIVLTAVGWWTYEEGQVSVEGLLWFGLLGLTAYSYGRFVSFKAITTIGPSRLSTIKSVAPIISLVMAVLFLGERPGGAILAGTALVIAGVILVSYEPSEGSWVQRGIIWGFASALSISMSVFIRKKGLAVMPNVGLTVAWSNLVSLIVMLSLRSTIPPAMLRWGGRTVVLTLILVGTMNSFNQVLWNLAVFHGDISVVTPILTSSPIFTLIFTALLLRGVERIRSTMILGVFISVAGMILIALGRG